MDTVLAAIWMSLESEKGGHLQETSDGFFPWNTEVSPFSHHPTLGLCLEIGYPWWITPFHPPVNHDVPFSHEKCHKLTSISPHFSAPGSSNPQCPRTSEAINLGYKRQLQLATPLTHYYSGWWCNNHLEKWWTSSMGRMTSHIWHGK